MKNKRFIQDFLLISGAVLLIVSLVVLIISFEKSGVFSIDREETVEFIENIIPPAVPGFKEELSNNEMPSVSYKSEDYDALLSVPRFSVTLPVHSKWDKNIVNSVPCRFTGNPYQGTLVIGGVDSNGQFDFISKIDIGDTVTVTDMKGRLFTYTVSTVKHAKNSKSSTLIDENYDLTLFAKNKKTGEWLLVRCVMS